MSFSKAIAPLIILSITSAAHAQSDKDRVAIGMAAQGSPGAGDKLVVVVGVKTIGGAIARSMDGRSEEHEKNVLSKGDQIQEPDYHWDRMNFEILQDFQIHASTGAQSSIPGLNIEKDAVVFQGGQPVEPSMTGTDKQKTAHFKLRPDLPLCILNTRGMTQSTLNNRPMMNAKDFYSDRETANTYFVTRRAAGSGASDSSNIRFYFPTADSNFDSVDCYAPKGRAIVPSDIQIALGSYVSSSGYIADAPPAPPAPPTWTERAGKWFRATSDRMDKLVHDSNMSGGSQPSGPDAKQAQ